MPLTLLIAIHEYRHTPCLIFTCQRCFRRFITPYAATVSITLRRFRAAFHADAIASIFFFSCRHTPCFRVSLFAVAAFRFFVAAATRLLRFFFRFSLFSDYFRCCHRQQYYPMALIGYRRRRHATPLIFAQPRCHAIIDTLFRADAAFDAAEIQPITDTTRPCYAMTAYMLLLRLNIIDIFRHSFCCRLMSAALLFRYVKRYATAPTTAQAPR